MTLNKRMAMAAIGLVTLASSAWAEPVSVTAVMVPQEQMKFEMGDDTKHFVLAVRRDGQAEGEGALAGATVTEFGWHDINPPFGGDPKREERIFAVPRLQPCLQHRVLLHHPGRVGHVAIH